LEDQTAVAATILRTVSESHTKTLAGGQIRQAIKASHPDFNFTDHGFQNLRDFIRKRVPALHESSRAGMDIVYAVDLTPTNQGSLFESSSDPIKSPAGNPRQYLFSNQQVWRAFASPNSPWKLYLEGESGPVHCLAPGVVADPSWLPIPACPGETLLRIAREFVEKVPEPFRPALGATLSEKKWWLSFYENLRNIGMKTSWIAFRRERIAEELDRTISDIIQRRRNTKQPAPVVLPSSSCLKDEGLLRKLAFEAVGKMNETELRSINIPLGYIIDLISSR